MFEINNKCKSQDITKINTMRHNTIYSGLVASHTRSPLSQGLTTLAVPLNQFYKDFTLTHLEN